MTPALHALAPGLWTTVQDLGRLGFQHLGVPASGALDPFSLQAANLLVGNALHSGALEVAYLGPTLEVEADNLRLAVVGARAAIEILPNVAAINGDRIDQLRTVMLHRGEVLRVGALSGGSVLYVAVEGGFDIAPVLGSVSTCVRSGFGGWKGRPLEAGDRLPLCRMTAGVREEVCLDAFHLPAPVRFRAIPGPQSDHFSKRDLATFFGSEYTISSGSDRMGMRLIGPTLMPRGVDIVSDGVAPGSIQVLGNGQPIVLLADRQTTGGYPKIATVISADLPALGRLAVGTRVGFEPVSLETAESARRKLFNEINSLRKRILPVGHSGLNNRPASPSRSHQ